MDPARINTTYLQLARHLEEADLVPLHTHKRSADGLRRLAARAISYFLAGLHRLLALPEGDPHDPATLAVAEDDKSSKPILLLHQGEDLFSDVAQSFVYLVRGPSRLLIRACMVVRAAFLPLSPSGSCLPDDALMLAAVKDPPHPSDE